MNASLKLVFDRMICFGIDNLLARASRKVKAGIDYFMLNRNYW